MNRFVTRLQLWLAWGHDYAHQNWIFRDHYDPPQDYYSAVVPEPYQA